MEENFPFDRLKLQAEESYNPTSLKIDCVEYDLLLKFKSLPTLIKRQLFKWMVAPSKLKMSCAKRTVVTKKMSGDLNLDRLEEFFAILLVDL